jgi:hypothetical protein
MAERPYGCRTQPHQRVSEPEVGHDQLGYTAGEASAALPLLLAMLAHQAGSPAIPPRHPAIQIPCDPRATSFDPLRIPPNPAPKLTWNAGQDWVLRAVTFPYGQVPGCLSQTCPPPSGLLTSRWWQCLDLNGHTNDFCPLWGRERPPPTTEETRSYAMSFKYAQRHGKLHLVALREYQLRMPDADPEKLMLYLTK